MSISSALHLPIPPGWRKRPLELRFDVDVKSPIEALVMGCGITDRFGSMMFGTNTWHTKQVVENPSVGDRYCFSVTFEANLGVGSYAVHCSLVENDTPENRSKNRRTKIIILPKIDQFYDMIEKEMKTMSK